MRGKGVWELSLAQVYRITPAYAGKRIRSIRRSLPWKDHPRLCGEKTRKLSRLLIFSGSPPPMRGKVHKIQAYDLCNRITPAYAGKRS